MTLVLSNAGEPEVEACRDLLPESGSDYSGVTLIEDLLLVRESFDAAPDEHFWGGLYISRQFD